jgi:hypothetical protein
MTNRDPATIAELLGLIANIFYIQVLRRVAKVKVHIDVNVEFSSHLKNPVDLAVWICVCVRCGAYGLNASL